MQYSGCSPAKALNIATDMHTGNPDLVGFYGACDGAGTGAGHALQTEGISACASSPSTARPRNSSFFKEGFIDALILQDPYKMGYDGVYAMDRISEG